MYKAQTVHTVQTEQTGTGIIQPAGKHHPETVDMSGFVHFVHFAHLYQFVHYVLILGMR